MGGSTHIELNEIGDQRGAIKFKRTIIQKRLPKLYYKLVPTIFVALIGNGQDLNPIVVIH